jgi:hypothetical protein
MPSGSSASDLGRDFLGHRGSLFVVAVTWLWSYVTFKRGARLITEVPAIVPDE